MVPNNVLLGGVTFVIFGLLDLMDLSPLSLFIITIGIFLTRLFLSIGRFLNRYYAKIPVRVTQYLVFSVGSGIIIVGLSNLV